MLQLTKIEKNTPCPCWSGKPYGTCCQSFHLGILLPKNAQALMRSRYSAYALHLAEYIMETTHPQNPSYSKNKEAWRKEILLFSQNTRFEGLKILEFIEDGETATVTFTAELQQGGKDVNFTEKSHFVLADGKWLYESGEML